MVTNPVLTTMLAHDRAEELRRHAQKTTVRRGATDRRQVIAAARNGTGWLLVDLGLRLAAPRNTMGRPVARGR